MQREEEWRGIEGWPDYEVSSLGRIRCVGRPAPRHEHPPRILKPSRAGFGYLKVGLYRDEVETTMSVHRAVATAFLGEREPGREINHIDEYVTKAENMAHSKRAGRMPSGDRNGSRKHPERLPRGDNHKNSRLREEDIPRIRAMRANGSTQQQIADEFPVSREAIRAILNGKTWVHVAEVTP